MKDQHKLAIHRLNGLLNSPKAVIVVLILLFIFFAQGNVKFEKENQQLLKSTNQTTQNTNNIVKGQTDILNAIKKLANDTKLDSNEKTNIIICMLQVPVAQRTTDLQEKCRKQVEDQLNSQIINSTPVVSKIALPSPQVSSQKSLPVSSANTAPNVPATQPDNPQPSVIQRITNIPGNIIKSVTNLL